MISFSLKNLEAVDPAHGVSADELRAHVDSISPFLEKIDARGQGFYETIDDEGILNEIEAFAGDVKGKYDTIVVLGIGGSALGTICLRQSLTHLFSIQHCEKKGPQILVADNIDPTLIRELHDVLNLERTLFVVVTKSGGTAETLSQYFYFRKQCDDAGLEAQQHFVFITDPEKGLLRKIATEEGIRAFPVPPNVGGRFSVLTPVGLVPAALIGIDIRGLIAGAQAMRNRFRSDSIEENLPFQLATIQYQLAQKGKIMNVMMPYSQKLIRFADWYSQLLAESIGKAKNEKGETVNVGITPICALGATDQHSQSQLYNEGPNDKFITFIAVNDMGAKVAIPHCYADDPAVSFLKDVDFETLLKTELEGTAGSYTQNNRPNMTITIEKMDEHNLGELFMLYQAATAFLGEFYGIDAFDQPGVELSKVLTKELLSK